MPSCSWDQSFSKIRDDQSLEMHCRILACMSSKMQNLEMKQRKESAFDKDIMFQGEGENYFFPPPKGNIGILDERVRERGDR